MRFMTDFFLIWSTSRRVMPGMEKRSLMTASSRSHASLCDSTRSKAPSNPWACLISRISLTACTARRQFLSSVRPYQWMHSRRSTGRL